MKSVKFLVIAMLAAAGMSVSSAELVRDGRAQCPVVIKPDAPPPVRFGAQELAKYLKKITGADLSIVKNNAPDQGGIYVGTLSDAELVKKANFMPSRLKEDGFAMIASGRNV